MQTGGPQDFSVTITLIYRRCGHVLLPEYLIFPFNFSFSHRRVFLTQVAGLEIAEPGLLGEDLEKLELSDHSGKNLYTVLAPKLEMKDRTP